MGQALASVVSPARQGAVRVDDVRRGPRMGLEKALPQKGPQCSEAISCSARPASSDANAATLGCNGSGLYSFVNALRNCQRKSHEGISESIPMVKKTLFVSEATSVAYLLT